MISYFNNNFMKCKKKVKHLYNYLFLYSIYNFLNIIFILGKCISYPFSLTYNIFVKTYRILSQYVLLLTKSWEVVKKSLKIPLAVLIVLL